MGLEQKTTRITPGLLRGMGPRVKLRNRLANLACPAKGKLTKPWLQ